MKMQVECQYDHETKFTYVYRQTDGEQIGSLYIKKYAFNSHDAPETITVLIQ